MRWLSMSLISGGSIQRVVLRWRRGLSTECVETDQARDFFPAQHRRQSAPVLGVRQEIAELVALQSLHEKESQGRDPVDHGAGCQLAFLQQIGLIGSEFGRGGVC